jgi:hypothetical protein
MCVVPFEAGENKLSPEHTLIAENKVKKSISQKIRSIEVLSLHGIDIVGNMPS